MPWSCLLVRYKLPQRVHEQHGEFGVAVGYVWRLALLIGESLDDLAEREERLVDVAGLLDHLSLGFALLESLASGQIHEADLAVALDILCPLLGLADDVDGHDRVAATGVLVHLMRTALPVPHAFQQNRDHVVDVATVHDDEVLDEEAVGRVPAAVQNS